MSWSCSVPRVKIADAEAAIMAADVSAPDFGREESVAAAEYAKTLANSLVHSGQLGSDPDTEVGVYMSGHANPGHVKPESWASDTITITVTQLQPEHPPVMAE
jgi:hypothetical protein